MMTNFLSFKFKWLLVPLVLLTLSIGQVWGVDTPVATFSASSIINNTTYQAYGNTDFYLSRGGNNSTAGWNKAKQAATLDSTWSVSGISTSTYGFYVKCKPGKPLSNINKIVITSSAPTNGYSSGDKLYLLYSTNNGKNWSQISLTSGTQGASAGTTALNKTFQFNTISSARYVILFSGESTSAQSFKFDNLQIEFYGAYTVTLDANGGSVTPTSVTQNAFGAAVTLPTPTMSGFTCTGWYTSTSGGTKRADAGGSYTPTANETVHAQWESAVACANDPTVAASGNGSFFVPYFSPKLHCINFDAFPVHYRSILVR